jgi:CDP-diacylglycerol--glycerol-3-phosphate 3-phosphatidyltransferase
MFALVANDTFWWPAVAIITVREVGIMGLRSYWGRKGLAIPASHLAKAKTVVQEVAVGCALAPLLVNDFMWVANLAMAAAVVLTVVSGIQYVVAGSRAVTTSGSLAS